MYKRRRIRRRPQASKGGVSDQSPKLANNNGSNDQLVALYRLVLLVPRETPKKAKMKKARRRPGFRSASRPYIPLGPRRMPWDDSFELLGGGPLRGQITKIRKFQSADYERHWAFYRLQSTHKQGFWGMALLVRCALSSIRFAKV